MGSSLGSACGFKNHFKMRPDDPFDPFRCLPETRGLAT